MKNTRRLFTTVSAVAVMSGAFGTTAAYAFPGDEKVFPASMCIRISGGTPSYNSNGQLFNTSSTTSMTIVCPLVRDDVLGQWDAVQVIAIDQHLSEGVSCRGVSARPDGNTLVQTSFRTTSGNSSSGQPLLLPGASEVDRGAFFVRCIIPVVGAAASGVASYLIAEE